MFKKFLIVLFFAFTASLYSQTWSVQSSTTTEHIKQIQAINADTVYALTVSKILKTTNGGTTWNDIRNTTIGLGTSYNGFQWLNAKVGYAWFYAGY